MRHLTLALIAGLAWSAPGNAQSLTRAQAIDAALTRGPRRVLADADTLAAAAQSRTARAFPNPALTTEFTKDAPQYHVFLEFPLDFGALRSSRVRAAEAARRSAMLRYAYDRASIQHDADTLYTRALALSTRAELSRRNAVAADSLRLIARLRRDAGDASDLEVELATVNAGQQANTAASDSLALVGVLLDLQMATGASTESVTVSLADTLEVPSGNDATPGPVRPLLVDAALGSLAAAEYGVRFQRKSALPWPALTVGVETHDPAGPTGQLPVVGLTLPIPLLNRNRGPILAAQAERDRAQALLSIARLEASADIARARRERDIALARIARDRSLLAGAERVTAMSVRAYQEGAAPLATVLEAQRTAREILSQYVDDVAAARIAAATLALLTLTAGPPE